jgi:hypothetical protein
MGYIASRHPDARFVVVSNDKGYGPMLEHAAELGFSARQAAFGAPKPAAKKAAAETTTAAKPAAKTLAKAPAKKVAAKKAASKPTPTKKAAAKQTASKSASPKAASEPASKSSTAAPAKAPAIKKAKGLDHVVASLRKTQSKPARQAALLAMIKSLLTAKDDDPAILKALNDLIAAGKVTISDSGAVQYSL